MAGFKISIDHTADWWLGNLDDPWFKALESAIQEEWDIDPLRIREGGVRYFRIYIFSEADVMGSQFHPFHIWRKSLVATLFIFRWVRVRYELRHTLAHYFR